VDETVTSKVEEYKTFVSNEKVGALATYVMQRKAILDLFEQLLEYQNPEEQTYSREDAIHRLICPMQSDSSVLRVTDHNLWIVDDRLPFCNFFASDKQLRDYTGVDSRERPDVALFYDACLAWRQGEQTDTVVIVEFKKPMREDYSSGRDPVQQVLHYVQKLLTERAVPGNTGRAIRGINSGTAFHCYIIADLTEQLRDRMIGRFMPTPDGEGYFGYSPDPPEFVEILPFGKLLRNARMRNAIFFQTLGIAETDEGAGR
jgi:hypothetical protein